jgi:hypothetical protein
MGMASEKSKRRICGRRGGNALRGQVKLRYAFLGEDLLGWAINNSGMMQVQL